MDVPGGEKGDGTEMLIPFAREGERRRLENKLGVRDIMWSPSSRRRLHDTIN